MKIIFLDRDGVINRYPGYRDYVKSWEEFQFLPGALSALRKLANLNYLIFIISNQGGVAKGLYTKATMDKINQNMLQEVEAEGGKVKGVYCCIHHPEDNCNCRKPKTGLIEQAVKDFFTLNIKHQTLNKELLTGSYFVGDSQRDIQAGKTAGCKTILVLSGRAKIEEVNAWELKPDFIVKDLLEAVKLVIKK